MKKAKWVVPTIYIIFLMLPIYWLLNMSFKTTTEIINTYTLWPQEFTLDNYKKIFTDSTWYTGYLNSIYYVVMNTVISVAAALPAAYAFSRYKFLGDKHLFFWLLTNRMAPPAVFALPFFQFYSSVNLFDTHVAVALSHCLFNIPLAVWILEGFMSSVPKELDENSLCRRLFILEILLQDIYSNNHCRYRYYNVFLFYVFLGRITISKNINCGGSKTDRCNNDKNCQYIRI